MKMVKRKKMSKFGFLFWLVPVILVFGVFFVFGFDTLMEAVGLREVSVESGDVGFVLEKEVGGWGCIPVEVINESGIVRGEVLEETLVGDVLYVKDLHIGFYKDFFYNTNGSCQDAILEIKSELLSYGVIITGVTSNKEEPITDTGFNGRIEVSWISSDSADFTYVVFNLAPVEGYWGVRLNVGDVRITDKSYVWGGKVCGGGHPCSPSGKYLLKISKLDGSGRSVGRLAEEIISFE